jgi:MFS family permease
MERSPHVAFFYLKQEMNSAKIQSKNARYHIIEGVLYISTGSFISAQTVMPALIKRLGGGDIVIGTWPVVVYLAYFLPQVFSANYASGSQYRKPFVIKGGLIQRMHILLIAFAIAIWGASAPMIALILLFLLFISNQATSGSVSPIWMDFLAKTTDPKSRGKLMGWRTSLAAVLGFVNGLILTALLTLLSFPYNYASAIVLTFLFQSSSLIAQQKIIEEHPSTITTPVPFSELFSLVRSIISGNRLFRTFLIASALLTVSFSAVAFFTVSAMERFNLSESAIGIFTILTIIGQILSGVVLGWVADTRGTKIALMMCAASLLFAILLAICAQSVVWYYFVFTFLGMNVGAEMFMRYNYAVECAPEKDRPMYVGIMNAWFAPFYIITPFAGWLCSVEGYTMVFWLSFILGSAGMILLAKTQDPRAPKLALSSK